MTLYRTTEHGSVPMSPAEEAEFLLLYQAPSPVLVPQRVTMRQARLALLGAGLLASVNSAIAGLTGTSGDAARIEWEYSQEVQRNKGLVKSIGPMLGLSDAQIDALFIAAAKL